MRSIGAILVALATIVIAVVVPAHCRELPGVALVIGEGEYDSDSLRDLGNPKNDARKIDELLGNLGFKVDRALDAGRIDLERDIERFVRDAQDADVALIYYSGHGIEAGGNDYLVPTDADISTPEKAGKSLLPLQDLLERLAGTVPVTIALLDACRTNAFPEGTTIKLPGSSGVIDVATTGLGEPRGAVPIGRPGVSADGLGMIIGFAASPGQAALDGEAGGNSPYAAALLKHFGAGGYPLDELMTFVRQEVYLKTNGRQLPWTNSSLRRVLSFGTPTPVGDADEMAIREGRRQLLLSIAETPDEIRHQVEAVASNASVPMDAVYGLLKALGQKVPSDPGDLERLLRTQAEAVQAAMVEHTALTSADPEILRLSSLAEQALSEGALDISVDFWEKAKSRYQVISESLDETESDLKARRLEGGAVIAKTAWAYRIKGDLLAAAENYRQAFDQVRKWDDRTAALYKRLEGNALETQGAEKGDNASLQQAIAAYNEALNLMPRASDKLKWATLQDDLGTALKDLGQREASTDSLDASVRAYRNALEERTRKRVPLDWAATQDHLGISLALLGERQAGTETFEAAIAAFHSALEEETFERAPLDWVTTQSNLGGVLVALSERKPGTVDLNEAVAALGAALEVSTRDRTPVQWAGTQINLGVALTALGKLESGTDRFKAAVVAYQAALEVMTRDRQPLTWALIQNGLGNALAALGNRESSNDNLKAAITAFRASLEERTRERVPLDWAGAQNNLGYTFFRLAKREKGTESVMAAITAYGAALEEWTRGQTPFDWAMVQSNLGEAKALLGERRGGKTGADDWRAAIAAWEQSEQVRTRESYPEYWASLQNAIGFQRVLLGERENDVSQFEAAIPILRDALAVHEATQPDYVPYDQDSLCRALLGLGSRIGDRHRLLEARSLCESSVSSQVALGIDASETQSNLTAVEEALSKIK